MHTWDFLPEFIEAFTEKLKADEKRWGATWLRRKRFGQEMRLIHSTNDRFDQFQHGDQPLDYLAIIGDAYINWLRDNHPDLWPE